MKTDLMLRLADLLDTVPEDRFDYGTWFCQGHDTASHVASWIRRLVTGAT